MTEKSVAAIILAAGKGTRMRSSLTKVLHKVGGQPMLERVLNIAADQSPQHLTVVIGDHAPEVGTAAKVITPEAIIAVQSPPKGTAHAVEQALPALEGFAGTVLVLYADTPLLEDETLREMRAHIDGGAAVAVLGFRPDDPKLYGRLKLNEGGLLDAIIEAKDATPEELTIPLCNSGVMAIDSAFLKKRLRDIDNKNAKGEYYLTDLVVLARKDGHACVAIEASADEVLGVDSRDGLAEAELIFQSRMRHLAMNEGATLTDPESVFFSYDTKLGKDVTIEPNVFFGPGVTIDDGVTIKAFSHLEGAHIKSGATIGPFARLRPGAHIGEDAKVGNFVEIKKSTLAKGAKVSHLTYIGDTEIGAHANIGAGTITCNYDGYGKHKTTIGARAFIGSNSSLVAPVTIGDGAFVGSGSVITKNVAPDDLAVARGRQSAIKGWAARFRKANGYKQ